MADQRRITLVCFGLVGTLLADEGLLDLAFGEAIATQGVVSGTSAFARCMAQVHRARGQAPADVLGSLFPENLAKVQAAQLAFERSLAAAVARTAVAPVTGAREVLAGLAATGCRICVMTILPRRELTSMLQASGLRDLVSVALTADDVPRGCPSPDLALAAMLRVGVGDVRELAVVHGTAAGVECGRRAGARFVAGVLTGPHPVARLRASGATHILGSVADLPRALARWASDAGAGAGPAGEGTRHSPAGEGARPGPAAEAPSPAVISVPPQVRLEQLRPGRPA
jgi:phosphoglycolate phosphatase